MRSTRCCRSLTMQTEAMHKGTSQILAGVICWWLIVHGTWLSGCTFFRTQPDAPLLEATAEQLIGLLAERNAEIHTMKGLFRAQVKGPGIPIAQRIEGVMFYRRPDGYDAGLSDGPDVIERHAAGNLRLRPAATLHLQMISTIFHFDHKHETLNPDS
jgi:hypothetical protein